MQNESKRYLQLVNDIRKEFRSHIKVYRNSNGLILNAPPMIMNRWKQCFQDLVGDPEMEIGYISKETEQENNKAEEMSNRN
jgi:hypothetical protein